FVRRDAALTVLDYPMLFPYGIVFNERRAPFRERRVRLAAALAIDRAEIVSGYLYGFGTAADGPVPSSVPGFVASRPIPTDRDSMPVAFLYYARGVQGINRRVRGVRMDVRGELPTVTQWRVTP